MYMKRMIAISMCILTLLSLPLCSFAGSEALSPGLDVIASSLAMYKTGIADKTLTFSAEDFESAVGVKELKSITVLSLPDPESGRLCLSSTPVMENQVISKKALSALTFVPNGSGAVECSFKFGVVSASQPLAFDCMVSLVPGLNFAPTTALPERGYISASTYAGVSLYGRLTSDDPEGDSVSYRVTAFPKNGTLKLSDREKGEYIYTPIGDFSGSDSFRYVAIDSHGNKSREVTVAVKVEKEELPVVYQDLDGERCELAAYRLAKSDIMVGSSIGGKHYFEPAASMTRAEFLALVMCIDGQSIDYRADSRTSFDDDGSIPTYLRSYISRAEDEGWIEGASTSVGKFFFPNKSITLPEAAQMIAQVMDYKNSGATEVFADDEGIIPTWAKDSLSALCDAGVLGVDDILSSSGTLTRADAAILLCRLMDKQ